MPEYLAPGVYVEETSYRSKTIEGVSTSTAGFVGPARFGPTVGEPELLTSFTDFERIYGGLDKLNFEDDDGKTHNYLAHAVRAFFEEGGKRLYVSRICDSKTAEASAFTITGDGTPAGEVEVMARYPGEAGNVVVTFTFKLSQNILDTDGDIPELRGASNYDTVWVTDTASPPSSPPGTGELYWLEKHFEDDVWTYRLRREDPDQDEDAEMVTELEDSMEVRILTVSVTMGALGEFSQAHTWEDLSFHSEHKYALTKIFAAVPANRSTALYVPLIVDAGDLENGVEIAEVLLAQLGDAAASPQVLWSDILSRTDPTVSELTFNIRLADGSDGDRPGSAEFNGAENAVTGLKSGLTAFEDLEDISIVAAPGSSSLDYGESVRSATVRFLISHCEKMRYRIGVLDSTDGQLVSEVRSYRGKLDSKYAALYYPWVTVMDPVTEEELNLPPSGFVSGIYARNDVEYGVHKAPANEVVRMAIGFETLLNKAQQEVLNPEGVNCFRFFEGRGYRLWGARTITSDPEWKYVNLRRYFAYLERSIEKHTQWVVFENNSTPLWSNVRSTVEDFLYNEWKSNHLMGDDPKEAYFVRCDRSTMTQNDIDNGRLICLVGVAPVRPAEFVIFRIGQWTADRKK
jgi:phage tail sheath protein FI